MACPTLVLTGIQGQHLAKSYGPYCVFAELSFDIAGGQCYALFGPNGAGKTTLLRILATLASPTAGQFQIGGHDGATQKPAARNALVFLAHGSHLYDELNAIENLRFALALRGAPPTDRDMRRVLDRVAIGAFAEVKIRSYSAGMKRRLAIAKAMLIRPQVLLLDEPYSSLDEAGMNMMNHYIRESTAGGAAVLMTTHDRVKSTEVAQRAGVLNAGTLRELSIDQVKADELS